MGRRISGVVTAAAFVLGLAATVAQAQEAVGLTFESPFAFVVGGKEMPAGLYELELQWKSQEFMVLRNPRAGESIIVRSIARLGDRGGAEPHVVFDKVQETYYLSEVHIPGADGFQLPGAPGEHAHARLVARR